MKLDSRFAEYTVLFVDDEEHARKYFPRIMGDGFRMRVASNVNEAKAIAAEEGDRLAVVISDQRMPGGTGVDLLTHLHQGHPQVIRILTTAYADLDSAVKAVNDGAVWRYLHKPWDAPDLRITVMRALELFLVTRERDILLREKLSALRRLIVIDRVRSYAVLATGLANRIRNPVQALRAFLDLAPTLEAAAELPGQVQWSDLLGMAQRESHEVLEIVQRVVTRTMDPDFTFTDQDVLALTKQGADAAQSRFQGDQLTIAAVGSLIPAKVDPAKITHLMRILVLRCQALSPEAKRISITLRPHEVWGAPGTRITLSVDAPKTWSLAQLQSSFLPRSSEVSDDLSMQADLLAAFFIAYHHSGDLLIRRDGADGPGFTVDLPHDPVQARLPDLDPHWIERVFTHFGD